MPTSIKVMVAGEEMVATAARALWWPAQQTLFIADVHAGKAGHFRRYGLAVPGDIMAADLRRLDGLIHEYNPQQIIILGDLFHSELNAEWAELVAWRAGHRAIRFTLVRGNHDRFMTDADVAAGGFDVVSETMVMPPFLLSHAPMEPGDSRLVDGYNLAGHLHPAVWLRGRARLKLRRPCFWFSAGGGVLPAFGHFTGSLTVHPQKTDITIAVGEAMVIRLPN